MPFRIIITTKGAEIHLYKVLKINNKNFFPDTGSSLGNDNRACIMKRQKKLNLILHVPKMFPIELGKYEYQTVG